MTTALFDFLDTIGLVQVTRGSEAWARPSLLHRDRYFELRQKTFKGAMMKTTRLWSLRTG